MNAINEMLENAIKTNRDARDVGAVGTVLAGIITIVAYCTNNAVWPIALAVLILFLFITLDAERLRRKLVHARDESP